MLTTEGSRCSASSAKSGNATDGAGDGAFGFSPPPNRLIASLGGNRSKRMLTAIPTAKPINATATSARRLVWALMSSPSPLSYQLHVPHAKIVEDGLEQRLLARLEIVARLLAEHSQDVDDLLGGREVGFHLVGHRIRDLAQVEQRLGGETEHEGREADRLFRLVMGRRAGCDPGRHLGRRRRLLGRRGRLGARLSRLDEPSTVRHPESTSVLAVLIHRVPPKGAGERRARPCRHVASS